jgi:hypothetical protein
MLVMTVRDSSSGMCLYTGSSRKSCPRSTSCIAQIEVMSLVQEATHITVFRSSGLAFSDFMEVLPKDLA